MKKIPETLEIEGCLVTLRTPELDDFDRLGEILNDFETMESLITRFGRDFWSQDDVIQRYGAMLRGQKEQTNLGFVVIPHSDELDEDGEELMLPPAGDCQLREINLNAGSAEFELILHSSVWGSGFAQECHLICMEFAFEHLGLTHVTLSVDVQNERMKGFLLKSGIERVGETDKGDLLYMIKKDQWPPIRTKFEGKVKDLTGI